MRRFRTVDVFTDRMFGGNPLAVVLDAEGLTTAQMQAIAREFNYAETTFVLPAADPTHRAHVRIFSPGSELPFAGHPNVGTAYVLATLAVEAGEPIPASFVFEEAAGLVALTIQQQDGHVTGAAFTAPQTLRRGATVNAEAAAACLGLQPADVCTRAHLPQVASVGLPFLMVRLATPGALQRACPDIAAQRRLLPLDGADGIYAYVRTIASEVNVEARMFAPLAGIPEDPATGSATAAIAAMLLDLGDAPRLRLRQGVAMGRPSWLATSATRQPGGEITAQVAGTCVGVMNGLLAID